MPTATNYDTAEYRATAGATSMNALSAYQQGATGAGVLIGIVDTGIDQASAEFSGRIAVASDVAGNGSAQDANGHGTAVAFAAAGRRNGVATHGIAFDAQIAAYRADDPGSCATTCTFDGDAIARGVDAARLANARVINLSLGGSAMPQTLIDAVGRATAAGIVVVIAAGNDGAADPTGFALIANDAIARDQVVIAGSVNSSDTISSFSNRAGSGIAHYLAAVGEQVRAPDETGTAYLWSGTSFATPQISGAVALLAQAFPNLSGAQIVDLLFRTARDAGAAGADTVYGQGILDLTRAFQPVGTTTLAGTRTAISTTGLSILSPAMGDAAQGTLGAVILDGYNRAFALDFARSLQRAAPSSPLAALDQGTVHQVRLSTPTMAIALTVSERDRAPLVSPTELTSGQMRTARSIAATVQQRFGSTDLALGFAQTAASLGAQLAGRSEPAFLLGEHASQAGFRERGVISAGGRREVAGLGISALAESGTVAEPRHAIPQDQLRRPAQYERIQTAIDARSGPLSVWTSAALLDEHSTVLGARFDGALGAPRATSVHLEAGARLAAGDGWSFEGSLRRGWTRARSSNDLRSTGSIRSSAFFAELSKAGLFGEDTFGVMLAQPLRVSHGTLAVKLPTGWNYDTGTVSTWTTQHINLAPEGRELDAEARYSRRLGSGLIQSNLFWRRDPDNVAAAPDEVGVAIRWSTPL